MNWKRTVWVTEKWKAGTVQSAWKGSKMSQRANRAVRLMATRLKTAFLILGARLLRREEEVDCYANSSIKSRLSCGPGVVCIISM